MLEDDPKILLVEKLGFDKVVQDMRGNLIVSLIGNICSLEVIIYDLDKPSIVISKLSKAQYCIDYMEGNIKCATSTNIG